jgi:hypothetical protein
MARIFSYPLVAFLTPIFNVWCVNTKGRGTSLAVPLDKQPTVGAVINRFFTEVIAATASLPRAPFMYANVQWVSCPGEPPARDFEIVIYFVPSRGDSILTKMPNLVQSLDLNGFTKFRPAPSACEVYTDALGPNDWALVALHEAMHNKLAMNDATLHNLPVSQGGGGVASSPVGPTWLPQNVRIMAQHIADIHPQMKNGCQILSDPTSGILR